MVIYAKWFLWVCLEKESQICMENHFNQFKAKSNAENKWTCAISSESVFIARNVNSDYEKELKMSIQFNSALRV